MPPPLPCPVVPPPLPPDLISTSAAALVPASAIQRLTSGGLSVDFDIGKVQLQFVASVQCIAGTCNLIPPPRTFPLEGTFTPVTDSPGSVLIIFVGKPLFDEYRPDLPHRDLFQRQPDGHVGQVRWPDRRHHRAGNAGRQQWASASPEGPTDDELYVHATATANLGGPSGWLCRSAACGFWTKLF